MFDNLVIPSLDGQMVFLNDLLREHQGSEFPIDSLGIPGRKIYLFEVKYFECDFFIEEERWRSPSGKEIKNPSSRWPGQKRYSGRPLNKSDSSIHSKLTSFLSIPNSTLITLHVLPIRSFIQHKLTAS
ncbi:hypothetical protein D3H55_04450 [Bacillus salacetis]|uniref:NERD domain-containing protein n=1 Tax=Bacillus salacetis TaxID=2315464 RepID=A0A3A1R3J7_9BACI|nr:hypothetical protein D3H55_04450 [Bacillus salacetis]